MRANPLTFKFVNAGPSRPLHARPRPMRASERIAWFPPAPALRPEPALVRADDLAALAAVLQVGRFRRLGHSPTLDVAGRFENCAHVGCASAFDLPMLRSVIIDAGRVSKSTVGRAGAGAGPPVS